MHVCGGGKGHWSLSGDCQIGLQTWGLHSAGEEEKGSEWVRKSQREAKIEAERPRCAPGAGSKTMGKRKSSLFIS